MIKAALGRYSADQIAKFDFALENSGAMVVGISETYPPALETYHLMGVPIWTVPSSPKAIIQVYTGYNCMCVASTLTSIVAYSCVNDPYVLHFCSKSPTCIPHFLTIGHGTTVCRV